eukprot:scaffold209783_cov21-Prasinocladus_malaysianus.AAC.2
MERRCDDTLAMAVAQYKTWAYVVLSRSFAAAMLCAHMHIWRAKPMHDNIFGGCEMFAMLLLMLQYLV